MSDFEKVASICLGILFIIGIGLLYAYVYVPWSQQARGPAIDLEIDVNIDENGNIQKYSFVAQMPDTYSSQELLAFVNSEGSSTIKEYFYRNITNKNLFDYQYNSDKEKITFKSTQTFDPNQEVPFLTYDKANWYFSDSLYKYEYFIPDGYINSIDYDLTVPAEIYETNGELSSKPFSAKNKVHWEINRHKEASDSSSKNVAIPVFYVNTSTPLPTPGLGLLIQIIGLLIAFIFIRKTEN